MDRKGSCETPFGRAIPGDSRQASPALGIGTVPCGSRRIAARLRRRHPGHRHRQRGRASHYQVGRALCYLAKRRARSDKDTHLRGLRRSRGGTRRSPSPSISGTSATGPVETWVSWPSPIGSIHAVKGSGPFDGFMGPKFDKLAGALLGPRRALHRGGAARFAGISQPRRTWSGKRVNIGNPGIGPARDRWKPLWPPWAGTSGNPSQLADELTAAQQSLALCHDRVQAMVLHRRPSQSRRSGKAAWSSATPVMVEVSRCGDRQADRGESLLLPMTEVPGGIYSGMDPDPVEDLRGQGRRWSRPRTDIGRRAGLCGHVRSVFADLSGFKQAAPGASAALEAERMIGGRPVRAAASRGPALLPRGRHPDRRRLM